MGRSGFGKTYSSLLMAYGLCGDWGKIALIDAEDQSASLYSHLGPFTTVQIGAPYSPSRFFEALDLCEDSVKEVIIIDSLSQEWAGEGGVSDLLRNLQYEDTLREHRYLLNRISTSSAHIICTLRTKQTLVWMKGNGRRGMHLKELPVQQMGIEYPFTTVLRLDSRHKAHVVKDRTGLFNGKTPAPLEVDHGLFLHNWCKQGEPHIPEELQRRIDSCQTVQELHLLLSKVDVDTELISAFAKRRIELEQQPERDVKLETVRGGLL